MSGELHSGQTCSILDRTEEHHMLGARGCTALSSPRQKGTSVCRLQHGQSPTLHTHTYIPICLKRTHFIGCSAAVAVDYLYTLWLQTILTHSLFDELNFVTRLWSQEVGPDEREQHYWAWC